MVMLMPLIEVQNHVTGGRGVAGSRKKLVSRAALKGFIRGMHGHHGHRGRGFLFQLIQVEIIVAVGMLN